MPLLDPDLLGPDLDLALLDFDELDVVEAEELDSYRALSTGLPARPGTRR